MIFYAFRGSATLLPKAACGSCIAHGVVVGAVERRKPMGQLVMPFRRWLAFQLFQLVREADECLFDHVTLCS